MKDKREECGCHRECSYDEHACSQPCGWPNCLNVVEMEELMDSLDTQHLDWDR